MTGIPDRLLRLRAVLQIVPVSKSVWYAGIQAGRYPKPVKLGSRCSAWRLSEIQKIVDAA